MSAIAGIESVMGSGMTNLTGVANLPDLAGIGNLEGGVHSLGSLPDSSSLTLSGPSGPAATAATPSVSAPKATDGSSFGQILDRVAAAETDASVKGVQLATGQLKNVHEFTAAAAQARLAVQMTAAVRNRALDAFSEIMRMPL